MAYSLINRDFYDAVINFEKSTEAQDYYYQVMDTEIERNGKKDTIRNRILRAYAILFCEDTDHVMSGLIGPEEVEATADRLYIGRPGLDPQHWYRMSRHFPVIDDDNYDRFAALVIADLKAGPLRKAAVEEDCMLLMGEPDPLHMTREQRKKQKIRSISLPQDGEED